MPSLEVTRPTRLELIRSKRRIVLAKRGLNLLKLKRSALIAEFFKISRQALQLRGDLSARLARGFQSIRQAEMMEGAVRLETTALMLPILRPLQVESRNVMGVRTPAIADIRYDPQSALARLALPASLDESLDHFQGVYQVVLEVAEKENAMRRLLREIEKTKRRASAIENVMIPRLEGVVRYIKFRFDEMERDSFAMLKTVKRKMERESAVAAEPREAAGVAA